MVVFVFQAEDGIRDLVRSRGLGDVYKRQIRTSDAPDAVLSKLLSGRQGTRQHTRTNTVRR